MLENIIKQAAKELREREEVRREVLSKARSARLTSKQSILLIHNGSYVDAEEKIQKAKDQVKDLKTIVTKHTGFEGYDEVQAAREEYAEAAILNCLITERRFPTPEDLEVPTYTFLLGLGDVVGELRREALDALRQGDLEEAEARFKQMEHIYLSLVSMEEPSLLLGGLRRKIDIARSLIERTWSELTAESSRRRLGRAINELADRLN